MTRYRLRTFGLELVTVAAGLVVAFPLYVLVNLAVRQPSDSSSPIAPTAAPTFGNFTQAWEQGALGGALANSVLVTAVSVAIVLAVSALAAYPLARVTASWSRWTFLLIMLGLVLPFQLNAGLVPADRPRGRPGRAGGTGERLPPQRNRPALQRRHHRHGTDRAGAVGRRAR